MSSESGKTATRSFRLNESALEALKEEATRRNVSVNTLVNQLLMSYTKYDRYLKRFQLVKLTGVSFRRLLEAASERTISRAGHSAGIDVPSAVIMSRVGRVSLDTVIDYLKDTGDYTDLYEYSEVPHEGKRVITLSHQYGPKGSIFISKYVEALLTSINIHHRLSHTSDSVMLEV